MSGNPAASEPSEKVCLAPSNPASGKWLLGFVLVASGAALAIGAGFSGSLAAAIGSIGAIAGAFAGYHVRRAVVLKAHLPDFVVAIAEDAIAIVGGLLIVSHV